MNDDEFNIIYDKEKDTIIVGDVEFSCEFFRQINSLKIDSFNVINMKIDRDTNAVSLGNGQYTSGRETIRISFEGFANYIRPIRQR